MNTVMRTLALTFAASGVLATSLPAAAATQAHVAATVPTAVMTTQYDDDHDGDGWNHGHHDNGRHRGWEKHRDDDHHDEGRYYGPRPRVRPVYYNEPISRGTRVWRGHDGHYYCRHNDGTTGLIVGGVAGALAGRAIAGPGGDRTLGVILGGGAGALLGREIDRGGSYCR
jgi:hypothetical protein